MVALRHAILLWVAFTSVTAKTYFSETFGDGWDQRWILSKWKESDKEKMGKWATATGKWFQDELEDRGLQTTEIMKFYSIAAPFESFGNEGKEIVIQYQAKYEKDLGCGGGYLKVGPKQADLTKFGEPTPYNIMFGPDQCNTDKRTHLIFNYGGKNFLKKSDLPYKQEGEGISHLYRLVVKPDSTVRVEVDQELLYNGSLKVDWEMLSPKEIPDPDDKKPDDWAEEAEIVDPKDVKPADWVTTKRIIDPDATKPSEWDEEEDGEWTAPEIDNPDFKEEWAAKRIPNPAYKGAWEARQIPNPDFVDDADLGKYSDFGYVGFDVYQVKGGTIFDNIIITDSIAEADEFASKWKVLNGAEQAKKNVTDDSKAADFEKFRAARAAKAAAAKAIEDASPEGLAKAAVAKAAKEKDGTATDADSKSEKSAEKDKGASAEKASEEL